MNPDPALTYTYVRGDIAIDHDIDDNGEALTALSISPATVVVNNWSASAAYVNHCNGPPWHACHHVHKI